MQHVDLYVNQWTRDLGETGASALGKLSTMAKSIGLLDSSAAGIEIFS
jgi:1,4-dihydroxy-6-naphthoate synthase